MKVVCGGRYLVRQFHNLGRAEGGRTFRGPRASLWREQGRRERRYKGEGRDGGGYGWERTGKRGTGERRMGVKREKQWREVVEEEEG